MSYRFYACKAKSDMVKQLIDCTTEEEFTDVVRKYYPEAIEEEDDPFIFLPDICEERIYEFGSDCDFAWDIYKNKQPQLLTKLKGYEDFGAIILTRDLFVEIIRWYEWKIITWYHKALNNEACRQQLVEGNLRWWEALGVLDLNKDHPWITSSCLYEHAIFELVRILKSFDWENDTMIFLGW